MLAARDAVGAGQLTLRRPSSEPAGAQRLARNAGERDGRRGGGAGRHRRRRGPRGRQSGAGLLGPVPGQRAICRPPRADLQLECRGLHLASRLPDGPRPRQPLGRCGHRLRDDQRDALLLQFPRGRPRQFHDHRPVGLGQDGGAELPRRPGAEVLAAHDPVRQGSRFGDFRARARRPLRADHARRADRLQSAAPARHAGQPRLPARLARRSCSKPTAPRKRRRSPRRSTRFTRTARSFAACASCATCSAAAAARSRATCRRGSTRGSSTASTPGCSTTRTTSSTSRTACSAST